jgi:hypothetical protein
MLSYRDTILGIALFFTLFFYGVLGKTEEIYDSREFNDYWYGGKAEITSYELHQARYGEIHSGNALLIFVTEDFSRNKHVKLDNPIRDKKDALKVLKLNFIRKFNTGIYQYAMMNSIFTPLNIADHPYSLKETLSAQEWCGNWFMQLNLRNGKYLVGLNSYFETEGDEEFTLEKAFLEDEIWTRIRIDPSTLPLGNIKIIPGAMVARFTHGGLRVEDAEATLRESSDKLMSYRTQYKSKGRTLVIKFTKDFPYKIISWKETYGSGNGNIDKFLTTKATRKKTLLVDYWNRNKTVDLGMRKELGLD